MVACEASGYRRGRVRAWLLAEIIWQGNLIQMAPFLAEFTAAAPCVRMLSVVFSCNVRLALRRLALWMSFGRRTAGSAATRRTAHCAVICAAVMLVNTASFVASANYLTTVALLCHSKHGDVNHRYNKRHKGDDDTSF